MNTSSRTNKRVLLEVAIDTLHDGLSALDAGADRLEVCARLDLGGLTPEGSVIRALRKETELPLFAMVRPRGGEFVYTWSEVERIRGEIREMKECGADGIVLGLLTPDKRIDTDATRGLTLLAHPLPVTFHRAVDHTGDLITAVNDVVASGAVRILTSGGTTSAWEGRHKIGELVKEFRGRLTVLPGGGVRPSNVLELLLVTGADEVHSAARDPGGKFDATIVRQLRSLLNSQSF